MNTQFNNIMNVIKYFFSPEDSATPIQNGLIYFEIEPNTIGIGSAKALFWVMNCMIFMYLLSLL